MTKSLQGQPSIFDQSFVSNKSLKYVQYTQRELDNIKHEGHGSGRKLYDCALPCILQLSCYLTGLCTGSLKLQRSLSRFSNNRHSKTQQCHREGGGTRGLPTLLEKLIF